MVPGSRSPALQCFPYSCSPVGGKGSPYCYLRSAHRACLSDSHGIPAPAGALPPVWLPGVGRNYILHEYRCRGSSYLRMWSGVCTRCCMMVPSSAGNSHCGTYTAGQRIPTSYRDSYRLRLLLHPGLMGPIRTGRHPCANSPKQVPIRSQVSTPIRSMGCMSTGHSGSMPNPMDLRLPMYYRSRSLPSGHGCRRDGNRHPH